MSKIKCADCGTEVEPDEAVTVARSGTGSRGKVVTSDVFVCPDCQDKREEKEYQNYLEIWFALPFVVVCAAVGFWLGRLNGALIAASLALPVAGGACYLVTKYRNSE